MTVTFVRSLKLFIFLRYAKQVRLVVNMYGKTIMWSFKLIENKHETRFTLLVHFIISE